MVRAAAVAAWAAAVLLASIVPATATPDGQAGDRRLLDVPYLPQSEDLCGGAAVAMVLRYWGDRNVHADDFSPLVDRSAAGIRTDALTTAVSRLGWDAFPLGAGTGADDEWIRGHLGNGRPIVALIQIAPGRYHYVVIVGWGNGRVIAHDPAAAPFTVIPLADFDRAWSAAGRWALLILPVAGRDAAPPSEPSPPRGTSPAAGPCGLLVQQMVNLARAGGLAASAAGLDTATQLCPDVPAAWREFAGVRFLQSRWDEAAALAERATLLEPADEAGWDLLATSRFLNDQPVQALRAWNRLARPTVDLMQVEGLRRTRHPVVAALVRLPPHLLLTPADLRHAARRLNELPSASATRLQYRPIDGGRATIEVAVIERAVVPRRAAAIAVTIARAVLQRDARLEVAAPTGSGELLAAQWRWQAERPRLALSLAVPAVSWIPGIITVEGAAERQSYALESPMQTERRHAGVQIADWASGALRWSAALGFDRWAAERHASAGAGFDFRFGADRAALSIDGTAWMPMGLGHRFAAGGASAAWRSATDHRQRGWSVVAGLAAATAMAPLDLWPGAGAGHARAPLLRAHPLLDDGVLTGEVFGRRLLHAGVEYRQPLLASVAGTLHLALFIDTARAWQRGGTRDRSALHGDAGTGLRVVLPGKGGTLRLDLARGLRDKRVALSTGWQAAWPGRTR